MQMQKRQKDIRGKTAWDPRKVGSSYFRDTSIPTLNQPSTPLKLNGWIMEQDGKISIGEIATAMLECAGAMAMIVMLYIVTIIIFSMGGY